MFQNIILYIIVFGLGCYGGPGSVGALQLQGPGFNPELFTGCGEFSMFAPCTFGYRYFRKTYQQVNCP